MSGLRQPRLVMIPSAVVHQAAADFEAEIAARRRVSKVDPVADGMEFVMHDVLARVKQAESDTRPLTAEAYAVLPTVCTSAQTIRRWCRNGELPGAVQTVNGWRVPRNAVRVKRPRNEAVQSAAPNPPRA